MKNFITTMRIARVILILATGVLACTTRAQTYETSLATTTTSENFDELGINGSATLPTGWVMAQGVGLPNYSGALNCQTPPIRFTNTPANCQTITRDYDGISGGTGSPTGGGRVNWGDTFSGGVDRSIGFMAVHSTATPPSSDFWAPTNFIMFGFYNNTGSNIISLAITNNVKMYRQNTTPATSTFYYSYDGSNWTHLSTGDVGPFPSTANFYYTTNTATGPLVSNVSFTISGLSVSNGAPFYLAWQFIIANASGSFSAGLGLDDFALTANLGSAAPVGNSTWIAGSGNWNTAANWKGSTLPTSGNSLSYAGAGGLTTNNLASITTGTGTIGSLTFSNTAGGYTLSGGAVSTSTGITNNSTATQAVNLPLTLLTDQSFVAAAGNLIFGGAITNGGYALTFAGASNLTLNGFVTGPGTLTAAGPGTLLLNGSNSYSGLTAVGAGTLQLGGSEKIPDTSAVNVGGGATLDLNNFTETIASLAGSGNVTLGNGILLLAGASGSATFSGILSGNGGLSKMGTATETISATNFHHGTTLLTAGTLAIANVATLGDGPLVLAGGTFQLTGTRDVTNGILANAFVLSSNTIVQNTTSATAGTRNLPFGGAVIATNGTLTIQNICTGNFTNVMHLRFYGPVTNFVAPVVFDNSLAGSQVNNTSQLGAYNTNGSAPQLYSGVISGPGHFFRGAIAAGTGGTAILTGNNTFTLGATVSRGYLGLGTDTISSGGSVLSGPAGTGTLEIDDDTLNGQPGVGIFAYGGSRVIENRVLLNGVTNAVVSGTNNLTLAGVFDVGGVPKILTVSNTAVTTISGQFTNTASFTKAGPGVLALTADNGQFWTGAFNLTAGTLVANNASGSATGTNTLTISGGTLSGTGLVASAAIATAGFVSPGNSVGTLTLQNGLDLSGGGALSWNLGANSTSNPGTDFSQLAVTGGTVNLGGSSSLTLAFTNSATTPSTSVAFWKTNHVWRIVTLSGGATVSGNFAAISNGSYSAGTFATATDANGVLLTYTAAVVPATPPIIGKVSFSGGSLSLYLTNGSAGATFQIVTATNLTQSLATWLVATNGTFASNGSVTNAVSINPADPKRFYRVKE